MDNDSAYVASGGDGATVGVAAWASPIGAAPHSFQQGVVGIGNDKGVWGMVDDGSATPLATLSGDPNFTSTCGVAGGSLGTTGVAGVSNTGVGVFGQSGAIAAPLTLTAGMTGGVLGASTTSAGVTGLSGIANGVTGRSIAGNGVSGEALTSGIGVAGGAITGIGVAGASSKSFGVRGQSGQAGPAFVDPTNPKPAGDASASTAGVFGTGAKAIGVAGTSSSSVGVLGQSGSAPAFDPTVPYTGGVVGTSRDASGLVGVSQNGRAVFATAQNYIAVHALATKGVAVWADSFADGSALASCGVVASAVAAPSGVGVMGTLVPGGPAVPKLNWVAGVTGSADKQPGVIGTSNFIGVVGYSGGAKGIGVFGQATGAGSLAGRFEGPVVVNGDFTVVAPHIKGAAVPFADGSHRVLHCMESPEAWFEDFGSARLKRGRAVVKLDADFAKVIKRGDYRVFPAPEGDCNGLYVRRKGAASFEVRELNGGTSGVAFSYRIVGRRKDIKAHKRFARIDIRPPLPPIPPAPPRSARGRKPNAAAWRALLARLKQARKPKGAARRKRRGS